MASFFFSQQAQNWQQLFRRHQSGGFFSRLIAWLVLGLVLAAGLLVIVTVLLLSWLLIPVLLFKKRRAAKARFAAERAYQQPQSRSDIIIEGGITEVKDERV
jgi:Flp pilus assembly protein TadB